ncbi:hypothetical protein KR222_011165 [Zaprionus bogoriensis]|nr:hypothetical protein KR222_011165 [Zaprionus bogoriensis]
MEIYFLVESVLIWNIIYIMLTACFADLQCYVCDDCAKVSKETPLVQCNEDYFNQGGSTEASTVTTTPATTLSTSPTPEESSSSSTTTTTTTSESTSVETSPTTEPAQTTVTTDPTTTEQTSEITETTETTELPMPTPATVGPPESTTLMPTPPSKDTVDLAIRQRRSLIDTSVSYHCYSVEKTANNSVSIERGCVRVETQQNACDMIRLQHNGTELQHCDPCSMNACNGATSMLQSSLWATLLLGLVAAALQRN